MSFEQRCRDLPLPMLRRMVRHPGREWSPAYLAQQSWIRHDMGTA